MSHSQNRTAVIVGLGVAQTLAWGSTYYLPAILAEPMANELSTSSGIVFTAFSVALIVSAIFGPAVGARIDRLGGRLVLTVSSPIFAVGLITLGLSANVGMMFAGWVILGIGMSMGLYEAAFATLTGLYGRQARRAITGITLIAGLASTICWPISAFIEHAANWRMACFFWAALHITLGLLLNWFLVPAAPAQTSGTQHRNSNSPAHFGPHSKAMLLLAFAFSVTWFLSTAMAAHLPNLLQQAGASQATAIAAAALIGPAQVLGRILEFGVLQRFHPLLAARLAMLGHPIGAIAVLSFGAPAAYVFAILHGAGNGILTIAKGTLPLAIFGPDGYGRRQGILMVPARFAQAGAPLIFVLLMDRYGAQALLASVALSLMGLFALMALNPTSKESYQ